MTSLSIVVPAYNEEKRLVPTLESLIDFAKARAAETEIIVVDDGSTDATAAVSSEIGGDDVKVISYPVNKGKGHAVRTGMLAASADHRLFTDADGSTPIEEYATLATSLDAIGGRGVAFGSVAVGDAEVARSQSALREASGKLGNLIIRALALPGVHDSQRGFKLFSADAAEAVFSICVVDGWGFDVEALALARRLDFPIVEVPVTWTHIDGGSITPMAYLTTLSDVAGLRWRLIRGAYDLNLTSATAGN
jgi:dolichyl-phosphate beta-glucosyltransferase